MYSIRGLAGGSTGVDTPHKYASPDLAIAYAATDVVVDGFVANWSPRRAATSYRIDVSTASNFASFVEGYEDLEVLDSSLEVTGLSADTAYYYRVRAVNVYGSNGNSNTIAVTTAAS